MGITGLWVIFRLLYCVSYSNNTAALTTELHYEISRVKVLAIYVSHGARHSDSCGDWHLLHTAMLSCCLHQHCGDWHLLHTAMLSHSLPILVNLKQRFMKFIHKSLSHKSPVINSVAKSSNQNPWSNCGGNFCHIRYEYNMHEDVSASVTGRVWQARVTDERISDVNVLSDMIEIRNGFKTCDILAMMMLRKSLLK